MRITVRSDNGCEICEFFCPVCPHQGEILLIGGERMLVEEVEYQVVASSEGRTYNVTLTVTKQT